MSVSENCGDASSRALSRFLLRFPTPTPVFRLGSASLITSTRLPTSSRRSRHRARPLSPHAIMTPLAGSPFPLPPKPSSMISSEGTSERCSPTRDGTCRVCQDAHLADPRPTTYVLRAPSRRLPELHSTPHPPSTTPLVLLRPAVAVLGVRGRVRRWARRNGQLQPQLPARVDKPPAFERPACRSSERDPSTTAREPPLVRPRLSTPGVGARESGRAERAAGKRRAATACRGLQLIRWPTGLKSRALGGLYVGA